MQKKPITHLCLAALAAGSILLAAPACKKSNHDSPPAPVKPYRILRERDSAWIANSPSPGINYYEIVTNDYQYDDKGNQISTKSSIQFTYSDGTSAESASSSAFQYDNRGFLTGSSSQGFESDRSGSITNKNTSNSYQYDQDRLTRWVRIFGPSTNMEVITYQWDAGGHLTDNRDTLHGNFNYFIHYDYSNGLLFKVTITDPYSSRSPFVEVNDQGLYTRTNDQGEEHRYQYDAEGEITRDELWINGVAEVASVYEYDHYKNFIILVSPPRKGFPTINSINRSLIPKPHNYSKVTGFSWDASGQWKVNSSTNFNYTYNSAGYPETLQVDYFDAKGVAVPGGQRSFFTYTHL